MAIIQECRAETSPPRAAHPRPGRFRRRILLAMAFVVGTACPVRAQQIQHQGGSTLELAPTIGSQTKVLPKVPPPLSKPGQNVLVIPRASRDFVGEWGGHLRLTRVVGMDTPPSQDSIVGVAFGESSGTVFMQTTVSAKLSSPIVDAKADVVDPKTIKVKLNGLETAFRPPLIHKEELHLELTSKNTMNCLKYEDFYQPGRDVPIVSMAYEGDLHLLSPEASRELAEQVHKTGQVAQKEIEGIRRFEP
jgi:hypothetical protein